MTMMVGDEREADGWLGKPKFEVGALSSGQTDQRRAAKHTPPPLASRQGFLANADARDGSTCSKRTSCRLQVTKANSSKFDGCVVRFSAALVWKFGSPRSMWNK